MNKEELEGGYRKFRKQSADTKEVFRKYDRNFKFRQIALWTMMAISGITIIVGILVASIKGA